MLEVKVKDICKVTQISSHNSHEWEVIRHLVSGLREKHGVAEVLLDFEDIELHNPYKNNSFLVLLQDKDLYFRVYNDSTLKNTLDMICTAYKHDKNRIESVTEYCETPFKVKVDHDVVKRMECKEKLRQNVVSTHDQYELNLYKGGIYTVSTESTVDAIIDVLKEYNDKLFVLDFGDTDITNNAYKYLANELQQHITDGNLLKIKATDNEELEQRLDVSISVSTNTHTTSREKAILLKNNTEKNVVGLFVKYYPTKSNSKLDNLGREGRGKVLSTQPAIFRGFKVVNSTYCAVLDIYEPMEDNFSPDLDYIADKCNGEDRGHELRKATKVISLNDIGFYNLFAGRKFHFLMPVQEIKEETKSIYVVKEDGGLTTRKVSIPEYMKIVLDEHNVKYNEPVLDECIRLSEKAKRK